MRGNETTVAVGAGAAHRAFAGRVLAQRQMSPVLVVIVEELREQSPQMIFIEHDDMIEQLPPTGPHPAFGHAILPGTLHTRSQGLDLHARHRLGDLG
jgi:hypothetical protein